MREVYKGQSPSAAASLTDGVVAFNEVTSELEEAIALEGATDVTTGAYCMIRTSAVSYESINLLHSLCQLS
jgi:hypothetical protein